MGKQEIAFNSALSKKESILVLLYLPVHLFILPNIAGYLLNKGIIGEPEANLLIYVVGALYMLAVGWKFLRRDFDPFLDNLFYCIAAIGISYGLMFIFNLLVNTLLMNFLPYENPNNAAIVGIADQEYGKTAALAIFLAPILEEMLFRAGIFGCIRKRSRILAYIVSVLAFSIYHIWAFALENPSYWIYIVQYIPVSYLLCRVYEKCGSIWSSIGFHMLVNAISIKVLVMAQEMLA